jgi:toxin ParE1/3/4
MTRIVRSPRAGQDLTEIALYLEARAGLTTADRFLSAAEAAFKSLAVLPLMGPLMAGMPPRHQGVRTWRVPGFRNYLIFYQPASPGIEILRVLHGARDIAAVFGETQ